MGMVGGGRGAFIGAVHRMAANLDGKIELVAGCFSSDPEKSKASGEDLFLDPSRVYTSYAEMAAKEAALPVDQRIDFVSIVVRNDLHVAVAKTFLAAGINVICEKPMSFSLAEGREFAEIVKKSGKVFALTHNYTGYPMVKEARAIVKSGRLGRLLKIVAEYPQGYASSAFKEAAPSKIANWRMDPSISGVSNCIGDIGSHAENLARYITGLEIEELAAELTTFIPGRHLDDDGNILVRYQHGVKGILYASQVSSGDENNLNIRVYGTEGSIEWHQEHPNELIVKFPDKPREVWRRGHRLLPAALRPSGSLHRGLRQHLPRRRGSDPRRGPGQVPAAGRLRFSGCRRRSRRHGLHRGRRRLLEKQRRVDQAGTLAIQSAEQTEWLGRSGASPT
jgi:predicted dehydrogenase